MAGKTGILIVNLGTPEATDYRSMRRYLKEFLSDKRVIENSGPLWWLVLNGIILTRRPKTSGAAYDKIWNREHNESPLKTVTRAQAEGLRDYFSARGDIVVDWAMRYGQPSIPDRIQALMEAGCERLLVFPLYPQYSGATTATVMDKVFDTLKTLRHQPAIRSVPPYFDQASYIGALADSLREHLALPDWQPDAVLASFHGLPQAFIDKGDPYETQCRASVQALQAAMGEAASDIRLTYQSRGRGGVWLGPSTEETLAALAREGRRNVVVITPGFAADCVETLEEIAIRARQVFLDAGGENFALVPALNATPRSIAMLGGIAEQQLQGWPA